MMECSYKLYGNDKRSGDIEQARGENDEQKTTCWIT